MWAPTNSPGRLAMLIAAATLLTPLLACEQWSAPDLERTGYVSMVFEIEVDGEEASPDLAEKIVELLKKRGDPKGEYGLQWQVVGPDRIEVRMPLAPPEIRAARRAYEKARDALVARNLDLQEVKAALKLSEGRDAKLHELAGASAQREAPLRAVVRADDECEHARAALAAADASHGAQPPASAAQTVPDQKELKLALRDAEEKLIDAFDAVREASFDLAAFENVLALEPASPRRGASIDDWRHRFPALREKIDDAVATYDTWRARRTFLSDPSDLKRLLRGPGALEFRLLAEPSPQNPAQYDCYREQLEKRGPQPAAGDLMQWFPIDNPLTFFSLNSLAELDRFDPHASWRFVAEKRDQTWYVLAMRRAKSGLLREEDSDSPWGLEDAHVTRDYRDRQAVAFTLNEVGGARLAALTGANVGRQLCIFVNDVAYSAAEIQSRISTHGIITGDLSMEKLHYLLQTLQAGCLPARLKFPPISETVVEPKR
jgi:hypothetical protein